MFRHNSKIEDNFSEASQQLLAGRNLESVLADYPDCATELEPMLQLILTAHNLPTPTLSPQALDTIEKRAQQAAKAKQPASLTLASAKEPPYSTRTPFPLPTPTRLPHLFPILRTNLRLATLLAAAFAIILVGSLFVLQHAPLSQPSTAVESYSGVIISIQPTRWLVEADTEVLVDSLTEIHGQPAIGAQMTCIAERLGEERYRALEVWILAGPGTPTIPPAKPTGQHPVLTIALAP